MAQLQRITVSSHQITHQSNQPYIVLTPEQYHYLHRVLRLETGDQFVAMDGVGHWWLSQLATEGQSARILRELADHQASNTELPLTVTLVAALPKGNGFDEVVRQVTELGVTRIMPVISDRTLLKPSDNRLKRWQRIANEAAEQSERRVIPTVSDPITLRQLFQESNHTLQYIAVARGNWPSLLQQLQLDLSQIGGDQPTASQPATNHQPLTINPSTLNSLTIAIGPEGGWTTDEIESAIAVGYQPISLGNRVLRAVTAPVVALATIAAALEPLPLHTVSFTEE
ncbi:MAG: 16S rRNA (uracil(1498)-N(3))-methyltransferase [Thainema sp.]